MKQEAEYKNVPLDFDRLLKNTSNTLHKYDVNKKISSILRYWVSICTMRPRHNFPSFIRPPKKKICRCYNKIRGWLQYPSYFFVESRLLASFFRCTFYFDYFMTFVRCVYFPREVVILDYILLTAVWILVTLISLLTKSLNVDTFAGINTSPKIGWKYILENAWFFIG